MGEATARGYGRFAVSRHAELGSRFVRSAFQAVMKPTWSEVLALIMIFLCLADFAPPPLPLCVQGAREAFDQAYFSTR